MIAKCGHNHPFQYLSDKQLSIQKKKKKDKIYLPRNSQFELCKCYDILVLEVSWLLTAKSRTILTCSRLKHCLVFKKIWCDW